MADAPRPSDSAADDSGRYLVTARKYRPQTFGDMVGQGHVAQTLRNALRLDRLAHAYLFSGPRGVGKTTAARILAKAVNCATPLSERDDAEPCRTCDACLAFEGGRALNVIEIDAASNNKVEDIRELRETVRIPPQGARKKVYILDEVHMLSASAFNALLKTLEEPPPYALFVFATTEPHKVLPTILSRTQRFDFRRIAVPEIVGRLQAICAEEGIEADDEALLLLARKADGALRDALSLFDQSVALCGTPLHAGPLRDALGVVDTDLFFAVTDAVIARDRAALLTLVDRVVQRGYDLAEFLGGLAEHLRDLLVAATLGRTDLLEATEATRARYAEASASWTEADLLHLLMLVEEAERTLKANRQPRLAVELALLKMASLEPAADLAALIAKLDRIEAQMEPSADSRPAAAEAPTVTETPNAYSAPAPSAPATEDAPGPAGNTDESEPPFEPEASPAPDDAAGDAGEDPDEPPLFSPEPPPPQSSSGAPPSEPEAPTTTAPSLAARTLFSAPALTRRRTEEDGSGASAALFAGGDGSAALTTGTVVAEPVPTVTAPRAEPDAFSISLGRVQEAWPRLVEHVKADRVHVGALLQLAVPHRAVRGAVEVAVPDEFSKTLLDSEAAALRDALHALLGEDAPGLRFVVRQAEAGEPTAEVDPFERLKQLRQEHPVFRTLFEKFGAEIVW